MAIDLPPDVRAVLERYTHGDDDLREVVEHAAGVARYAIDRTLAHHLDPARFPVDADRDSFEHHLLAAIQQLPAEPVRTMATQAQARLAGTAAQRVARYGFAGSLDPASPKPVRAVIRTAAVPEELRARAARVQRRGAHRTVAAPGEASQPGRSAPTSVAHAGGGHAPSPAGSAGPHTSGRAGTRPVGSALDRGHAAIRVPVPTRLRLTVSEVHVVDKTNELSRDEIAIGAVVLDPLSGQRIQVSPVALGKFRRNDQQNEFSPVELCAIDLQDGAIVPQFVFGNLFLAETDRKDGRGGFAAYVAENGNLASDELVRSLDDLQIAVYFTLVGGALGGTALAGLATGAAAVGLGLLGLAGGLLVGAVVGVAAALLFEHVFVALGRDEIFGAQPVGQAVDPDGGLGMSATQTVTFERPRAAYSVTFTWDVEFGLREPPPPPPPAFGAIPLIDPAVALANLQDKVDHVVVLMLENRSFDQMLGYLKVLRGRADVEGLTGEELNVDHETGQPLPVHALTDTVFELDPPHNVSKTRLQMSGDPPMGGFVDAFVNDPSFDPRKHQPGDVMGYYRPEQVPVFDFIASQFAICDAWHAAFAGNTWINRTIAMAGQPARDEAGNLFIGNEMPLTHGRTAQCFFRRVDEFNATLRDTEQAVDWRCYAHDFSTAFIVDPDHVPIGSPRLRTMDQFLDDLASGDLPQISWLDPNYVDFGAGADLEHSDDGGFVNNIRFPLTANDDHPPTDIAHGQVLLATLVFSIMQSPLWEKTLFVITYDEHGGMFDHVEPPPNPAPESDDFASMGVRVPALIVSPWVEAGSVSKIGFDHTSIINTILTRFCLRDGQIPQVSRRVDRAPHLGHVLVADSPRFVDGTRSARRAGSPAGHGGGLPRAVRDDVLRSVGKRILAAEARPRAMRPLTDLERDIEQVREYLRSQGIRGANARR